MFVARRDRRQLYGAAPADNKERKKERKRRRGKRREKEKKKINYLKAFNASTYTLTKFARPGGDGLTTGCSRLTALSN
jgi:hypothetical protein